jgi:hypothetical protein
MGKAWQAPMDSYKRNRYIAEHAILRLRERLEKSRAGTKEIAHRDDEDLANLIDTAVQESMDNHMFEQIVDDGDPATLVDISEKLQDALYAVVKRNSHSGKQHAEAVVTLLTKVMVDKHRRNGKWGNPVPADMLGSSPTSAATVRLPVPAVTTSLGDKLAAAVIKPAPAVAPIYPKQKSVETRLVSYVPVEGNTTVYCEYTKDSVAERVGELMEHPNVRRDTIQVWKPVAKKTRVVVELED